VSSDIIVGVKYFLSQRIASLLFFRLVVLNISSIRIEIVIIRTILFKLGVPPFHSWLIRVLGELKPIFIFFLFTVQKLVPFFILSQLKISERVRSLFLLLRFLFILTRLNKITSFYVLIFFSSVVNTL